MKLPLALIVAAMLLSACTTPEFQPYAGPAVHKGVGGTYKQVRGMDVWANGTPPRTYRILGIIEYEGGTRATTNTVLEDLVKAARPHGGDALIVLGTNRSLSGINLQYGRFISRPSVKAAVIKYL